MVQSSRWITLPCLTPTPSTKEHDRHDEQGHAQQRGEAATMRSRYCMTAWRKNLEIISEASRRVALVLKARHLSIAWKDMAGAGNVYRHNYEDVAAKLSCYSGSSEFRGAAECDRWGSSTRWKHRLGNEDRTAAHADSAQRCASHFRRCRCLGARRGFPPGHTDRARRAAVAYGVVSRILRGLNYVAVNGFTTRTPPGALPGCRSSLYRMAAPAHRAA
jgi:hypothetical protein